VSKKSGRMVERLGSPDPSKGSAAGVAATNLNLLSIKPLMKCRLRLSTAGC
jgi:hypothetical protein